MITPQLALGAGTVLGGASVGLGSITLRLGLLWFSVLVSNHLCWVRKVCVYSSSHFIEPLLPKALIHGLPLENKSSNPQSTPESCCVISLMFGEPW